MSLPGRGLRRTRLGPRTAEAFAPAAITNFFEIYYDSSLHPAGATGGGYILSKGTVSEAAISRRGAGSILTTVNGNANFDARTTRKALELLLSDNEFEFGGLEVNQVVGTPIGSGFGTSAASATSAVYATAAAAQIEKPKRELALYAHRAEILEQTGLGTVSVVFNAVGAGAIIVPGEPGRARFLTVVVPKDTRIVTAFLAPFDKKQALSSESVVRRINRLGRTALEAFMSDPTLDSLAQQGEKFSGALGLETPEVRKLIRTAKSAGAPFASQNMIGYSIHSIVNADECGRVAKALIECSRNVRVDTFEIGTKRAGVLSPSRRSKAPS